jgi:hypothetical protein
MGIRAYRGVLFALPSDQQGLPYGKSVVVVVSDGGHVVDVVEPAGTVVAVVVVAAEGAGAHTGTGREDAGDEPTAALNESVPARWQLTSKTTCPAALVVRGLPL